MIFDTHTYTALKNNHPTVVGAMAGVSQISLPLPVIAELKHGFLNGARTELNTRVLDDFLLQPSVSVLFPSLVTSDRYAELRYYAQQNSKALSNNDIWIAALALETQDDFMTFDKDFAVFREYFGDTLQILAW